MTTKTSLIKHARRQTYRWHTPLLLAGVLVGLFMLPVLMNEVARVTGFRWGTLIPDDLAPLFSEQIDYWSQDIVRWADNYSLDPNLLATVMQIESCGHPSVISSAGAQGLFQVMPFHFATGENMIEPETNAKRGASFLRECGRFTDNDPGMMLACYNGGPSITQRNFHSWADETKRYYFWGVGIYSDARNGFTESQTLNKWLDAGGRSLCQQASQALGLR
jgi:hypothetical protein